MKRDTGAEEQIYRCYGTDSQGRECGQLHQEATVAVREEIVDKGVERTMYCSACNSEALKLCTEAMAVDHGRRVSE